MLGTNSLRDSVKSLLSKVKESKYVCIITHKNADPDALASTIAFKELLEHINYSGDVHVLLPEGVELASKNIVSALGIDLSTITDCDACTCDTQVILDTASLAQLGKYSQLVSRYIVIDHHDINNLIKDSIASIYDPKASSTSELVSLIYQALNLKPSREVSTLLLSGIIYDTRFFHVGVRPETFIVTYWLLINGADYGLVVSALTRRDVPYAERIAKIKAALRAGLYAINDYILVITCIGAYESAVLKALQDLGADIGIAIAPRKDHVRVTIRASQRILSSVTSILAADLASIIGKEFGGSGGGHGAAAGAIIKDFNALKLLSIIKGYFESKGYKFRALDEGRWRSECGG